MLMRRTAAPFTATAAAATTSAQRRWASSTGTEEFGGAFNPYKILGITPQTPANDVKRAYQRLALRYHPDNRETGDAKKFQAVHEAYKEVKDGKVWTGGNSSSGEGTGARGDSSAYSNTPEGRSSGYYTYEKPGTTTENYFANNRRMTTFGLLVMAWCFGFIVLRILLFIIFPLRGQAPRPPPEAVGPDGQPLAPNGPSGAAVQQQQQQAPQPNISNFAPTQQQQQQQPRHQQREEAPSSASLGTDFARQAREEAAGREQSGLRHVGGDMGGSAEDGRAAVYSIDFSSDEVKPEPKKKGWWGV